jgi:hypothetical protein
MRITRIKMVSQMQAANDTGAKGVVHDTHPRRKNMAIKKRSEN